MAVEIKILALGSLLLFIYIFTATRFKTQQYGRVSGHAPLPAGLDSNQPFSSAQ